MQRALGLCGAWPWPASDGKLSAFLGHEPGKERLDAAKKPAPPDLASYYRPAMNAIGRAALVDPETARTLDHPNASAGSTPIL